MSDIPVCEYIIGIDNMLIERFVNDTLTDTLRIEEGWTTRRMVIEFLEPFGKSVYVIVDGEAEHECKSFYEVTSWVDALVR